AVDRKTARRYVEAAVSCGLVREAGEGQLTDGLLGQVCELVRPHRPDGHGEGWAVLRAEHDQLKVWLVDDGLTVVKAHELLARRGVVVPPAHVAPLRAGGAGGGPLGADTVQLGPQPVLPEANHRGRMLPKWINGHNEAAHQPG